MDLDLWDCLGRVKRIIAKFCWTDLVICSHFTERKTVLKLEKYGSNSLFIRRFIFAFIAFEMLLHMVVILSTEGSRNKGNINQSINFRGLEWLWVKIFICSILGLESESLCFFPSRQGQKGPIWAESWLVPKQDQYGSDVYIDHKCHFANSDL